MNKELMIRFAEAIQHIGEIILALSLAKIIFGC